MLIYKLDSFKGGKVSCVDGAGSGRIGRGTRLAAGSLSRAYPPFLGGIVYLATQTSLLKEISYNQQTYHFFEPQHRTHRG